MPFEPDWSKILSHSSVTNQLREYHRQIAPYLNTYPILRDKPDPSHPPEDNEIPEECPKCNEKLIMKGERWGFCDNCVCEITIDTRTL